VLTARIGMVHSVENAYRDPLNKQISGLLSQTTGVKTRMKHLIAFFVLILIAGSCSVAAAQQTYTSDQAGYTLELPSSVWRAISEPDAAHEHAEFVNGDRLDGFLQIRKEVVDAGTTPSDLARRDLDQKLRFLPGFVQGKEEPFKGRLNGVTVSYEFIKLGKPMMGRIYYLQADNRTIYALRFSGLRDKLARIRNQTDMIARSFQLK
jgi:hypothetical protein